MTNLPRVSRLRIAAVLALSFAIGMSPVLFTGDWNLAFASAAVLAAASVAAWIGYRIGHANARAERAYQVELARGDDADPDPFATQLRVEHRDDLTYDVTVGLHGLDNPELLRDLTRNQLITTLAIHGVPAPSGDTVKASYVIAGGKRITWAESTTDTTGETR